MHTRKHFSLKALFALIPLDVNHNIIKCLHLTSPGKKVITAQSLWLPEQETA